MKIRGEQAYGRILDDFVAQRMGALVFIAGFRRLWQCDAANAVPGVPVPGGVATDRAGLYGPLDAIHALCETYANSLTPGAGYRVSEEQFRKEVASRLSTSRLSGSGPV